jgi:hypothetical protein
MRAPRDELRLHDLPFYDAVADEIAQNRLDRGLWLKALAECDGDEPHTRALYIRWRTAVLEAQATAAAAAEAQREIPSELFDGHPDQLQHPVSVSEFASRHKMMDLEVIEQIKHRQLKGVRFEGDWYVDDETI